MVCGQLVARSPSRVVMCIRCRSMWMCSFTPRGAVKTSGCRDVISRAINWQSWILRIGSARSHVTHYVGLNNLNVDWNKYRSVWLFVFLSALKAASSSRDTCDPPCTALTCYSWNWQGCRNGQYFVNHDIIFWPKTQPNRPYSQLVRHLVAVCNTTVVGHDFEPLVHNDWHKTFIREVCAHTHTQTYIHIIKLMHF